MLTCKECEKSKWEESGKWETKHVEEKPGRSLSYWETQAADSQQAQKLKKNILRIEKRPVNFVTRRSLLN